MKAFKCILKIVLALAAIAGAIYVAATYGEQIVAWCKKMIAKCSCCCDDKCECCEDGECTCDGDCDCCDVAPEEAPAEEEAPVADEAAPVADEADFEG